jgi:hypothetical protein
LRINSSLFEKRDDGLKTFVGMMQEDVVLADRLKAATRGLKWGWGRRCEERIVEVRQSATGLGQCEELCQVDRARDSVDVLVGKFKMAKEIGFDFDGAILCEFETNGGPSISLLEFLLDREEEVVGFLLVDIELAVSGDPGGPGSVDFHARKNFRDKVAD